VLMNCCGMHITAASAIASFLVGVMAVFLSPVAKMPAETCFFPALLPMIPGMYAYRAFGGLAMCVLHDKTPGFDHYFSLFAQNSVVCLCIILGMVVGATLPIFMFKKISFGATRRNEK